VSATVQATGAEPIVVHYGDGLSGAVRWAHATGLGRRMGQEDAVLCRPTFGFWGVADGLGGHAAGEVASALAVDVAGTFLGERLRRSDDREARTRLLAMAIDEAHGAILHEATVRPGAMGMGTTVACVLACLPWMLVAHVGDSRVYGIRRGRLIRFTQDHARPAGLLRCLGSHDATPDILPVNAHPGDVFLLATDGFWQAMPEGRLRAHCRKVAEKGVRAVLSDLMAEAAPAAGDNFTAVLLEVA
jgi:protein phosphatase